ncbi:MAG: hypothetical protein EOO20_28965 [Chryseobacterium sp.]|nr:MAG: hypothetical protein EOO20_28965 [Chryseobacterium sp.]
MSKGTRIIPHIWYKDSIDRIWVVIDVMPLFSTDDKKEVRLLEFSKLETISRPYTEILDLIESGTFVQVPTNAKLKIFYT